MATVLTVRDFSVIFDAYFQIEESMLAYKMENVDLIDEDDEGDKLDNEEEEDVRMNVHLSLDEFEKKILKGFWLYDDHDIDLRLARLENLINRRYEFGVNGLRWSLDTRTSKEH